MKGNKVKARKVKPSKVKPNIVRSRKVVQTKQQHQHTSQRRQIDLLSITLCHSFLTTIWGGTEVEEGVDVASGHCCSLRDSLN